MTTLSTHDTKRSEDVRARLAVLAELPDRVGAAGALAAGPAPAGRPAAGPPGVAEPGRRLAALAGAGARLRREGRPRGGHLDDVDRPGRGVRGAGCTPWSTPRTTTRRRTAEIEEFVDRIAPFGWSNSLSQKLLQLTMPGVPDVYQGTELWDFSLVDPDNRRPVDYAAAPRAARRAGRRRGAGRRRDRRGQAAGGLPGAAGPPGPPGVVRRVRAGRGRPARRPTTWSPSTAAASVAGGDPAAGRAGRRRAGATPRCSCPTAPGGTCSPASGSSPTSPAWPPTSCSPGCRWPCSSATEPRPAGDAARRRRPAWRRHAGAIARSGTSVRAAESRMRHLASSGRPGLPGRARGAGPPNPVRRRLTPTHPGRGRGTHSSRRATRVLG